MGSQRPKPIADERDVAGDYARALLADLGAAAINLPERLPEHPAASWARSGAMALTGQRDEAPRICTAPLAACTDGVLLALANLAEQSLPSDLNGACLLGERAAISGYQRNGSTSPGGSCRFLTAADGWIALNLAREEDWQTVSALVGRSIAPDWSALTEAVREQAADALLAQGRELGLPIAKHGSEAEAGCWHEIIRKAPNRTPRRDRPPLVIDLSSLWAGPLCGHLLELLGARVIKVEGTHRPDGARQGPPAFYDLLNAGKESIALDLSIERGREQLRALIAKADIVIEASRPRAMAQVDISAEKFVAENPGLTWISITGYGRAGDQANWVAFGDDAGVSAGASQFLFGTDGTPIFCGDAIGDPLTGLHGALAAWSGWQSGAGGLTSLSLCDVVAHCIAFDRPPSVEAAADREREWRSFLHTQGISAAAPAARRPKQTARPLGADTAGILMELGINC